MHVLFYVEPLTERDRPTWKAGWVEHFVSMMIATVQREIMGAKFFCIVGDGLEAIANASLRNCEIAVIHHTELVPKFGASSLAAATNWYQCSTQEQRSEMAGIVIDRVKEFKPDACITFSPAPFLRDAFPKAPLLHFELGLVSRQPFPMTAYLDPLGMFNNSYPLTHRELLESYIATDEEWSLVERFRDIYLRQIAQENPIKPLLQPTVANYKSSVLLALQFSQFYGYDAHASFPDQYDLIIQTLTAVPEDTAVLVVEHPQYPILSDETLQYLRSRYKNFVWLPQFRELTSASQYLLETVDAVITVSSSVGLQAMLWKKPLIVLGNSHLDVVADSHSLADINDLMQRPWPQQKEHILAWHLSRYSIPFSLLFDEGLLVQRIRAAMDCLNAGGSYDHYYANPFAAISKIATTYAYDNEVTSLRRTLESREAQISDLNQMVAGYSARISELAEEQALIRKEFSSLASDKLLAEKHASRLHEILAHRDMAIASLHETIRKHESENGELDHRVNQLKEALDKRDAELEEMKVIVNKVKNSLPWKTLAPIRALSRSIIKMGQK